MLHKISKQELPFSFLKQDFDFYQNLSSKSNSNFFVLSFPLVDLAAPFAFVFQEKDKLEIIKLFIKYTPVDLCSLFGQQLIEFFSKKYNNTGSFFVKYRIYDSVLDSKTSAFLDQFPISSHTRKLSYVLFSKSQYQLGLTGFLKNLKALQLPSNFHQHIYRPLEFIDPLLLEQGSGTLLYSELSYEYPDLSLLNLHTNTGENTWTSVVTDESNNLICWLSAIVSKEHLNLRGSSACSSFPTRVYWIQILYFLNTLFDIYENHKVSFALQPGNTNFLNLISRKIAQTYPGVFSSEFIAEGNLHKANNIPKIL